MSSEQEQIRQLAERIARRLADGGASRQQQEGARAESNERDDVAALRAGLAEIQRRLAHIESHIGHDDNTHDAPAAQEESANAPRQVRAEGGGQRAQASREQGAATARQATQARSTWLSGTYVPATAHPSDERFGISEAVSELVDYFEREKTCTIEPGGKPCDHCAMCSSRGF
ncbi:MAG TPA: hypothetical protein VNA19_15955 [Pyrinomonadaceae bacterium]|nr:hypothetical protein [Pyrinomonadaceae bacterium]